MNNLKKYFLLFLASLLCSVANAGDVLSIRQANLLKEEGKKAFEDRNYIMAIQKLEPATIAYKKFGKVYDFLLCSEWLSRSYEQVGSYNEAIRVKEAQIEVHMLAYSNKDADYSMHIGYLAHLYGLVGDYNGAIVLAKESMNLKKDLFGDESDEYVTALNNVAYYYCCLGNYDVATSYIKISEEIIIKTKGDKSKEHATCLNYLASVCFRFEIYEWALDLETKCVDILSHFKNDDDYYVALQNLALYKYKANHNDIVEAVELTKQSIEIQKRKGKTTNPFYGIALCNLMSFYVESSQYEMAEKYGMEAMELYRKLYGENHPNITTLLVNLSALYVNSNQEQKAVEYIIRTTEHYYLQTKNTFKNLTKRERDYYWLRYEPWCMYKLPEYALKMKNDKLNGCLYDACLFSKGLLLNSEIEISEIIKSSGNQQLIDVFIELQRLNNEINILSQSPDKSMLVDMDSLRVLANLKEQQLIEESSEYGDFTRNLNIRWENIQDKIDENDVAIEFFMLPHSKKGNIYAALLIRKGWASPKMVKLDFNDSILDQNYLYISKSIWQPLLTYMNDVENIYFAPIGLLHSLPIESIPLKDNGELISDKYNLFRLSSTRELAFENHLPKGHDAVLYGGIKYNTDLSTLMENVGQNNYAYNVDEKPNGNIDDLDLTHLRGSMNGLKELPGTKREIEQIISIINNTSSIFNVENYTGAKGTETSFKLLSGQNKKIIHIATHGFYLGDDNKKLSDMALEAASMMGHDFNDVRSVEDKSLTRCGLFFAGADNVLLGEDIPEGFDDGVLTAQEISTLDLRGLELVTLSACHTAQGDIMNDGVFGLQRGFKKAGAKSILMSLWEVNDEATCLLMTEFYKNWIAKGKNKHDALELAKQTVRSHKEKDWDNPKYWAAFILLDALD